MKKSAVTLLTVGVITALTACSKTDKPAQTTTASVVASTVMKTEPAPAVATAASRQATSVSAPNATIVASNVVVAPAPVPASAPTVSSLTSMPAAAANSKPAIPAAADNKKLALQADLNQLFKTLNQLDRQTAAKQAELAEKMQNAKTPADQQAFFKAVATQLENQKTALNGLKFNDPRVAAARNKMVESINHSRSGTQALAKNPTATPQTHPEIAKDMEAAQKSAEQARDMIGKLTAEAGLKPQDPAPAAKK